MITFEQFVDRYTTTRKDGSIRILRDYKDRFGEMSFKEAYNSEVKRLQKIEERCTKIRAFEEFLIKNGVRCEQSKISESRYYTYNNVKYRFSGHVYPTGSMTNEMLGVIDLAADMHLIDNIIFRNYPL